GRLAGHVRPGQDGHLAALDVEVAVVRDEGARLERRLDDRVARAVDRQRAALVEPGAAVAALPRDVGQRRVDVGVRERAGEPPQAEALLADPAQDAVEGGLLERGDPLLAAADPSLELLQLRRYEPL